MSAIQICMSAIQICMLFVYVIPIHSMHEDWNSLLRSGKYLYGGRCTITYAVVNQLCDRPFWKIRLFFSFFQQKSLKLIDNCRSGKGPSPGRDISLVYSSIRFQSLCYLLKLTVVIFQNKRCRSSLHCNISLSFCALLYNGVCFFGLKLSISDVIISQKGSNGDRKLQFFKRDYNFTRTLCAKLHLWAEIQSYS